MLLVHVSMTPIEVEKLKSFCESFGFETLALPDLSTSMDGFFGEAQGKLATGGIGVDEIRTLSEAASVISIGASMSKPAEAVITSYSIHYTKLYDDPVKVRERGMLFAARETQSGHLAGMVIVVPSDSAAALRAESVITSYSIHYTKLYDFW